MTFTQTSSPLMTLMAFLIVLVFITHAVDCFIFLGFKYRYNLNSTAHSIMFQCLLKGTYNSCSCHALKDFHLESLLKTLLYTCAPHFGVWCYSLLCHTCHQKLYSQ